MVVRLAFHLAGLIRPDPDIDHQPTPVDQLQQVLERGIEINIGLSVMKILGAVAHIRVGIHEEQRLELRQQALLQIVVGPIDARIDHFHLRERADLEHDLFTLRVIDDPETVGIAVSIELAGENRRMELSHSGISFVFLAVSLEQNRIDAARMRRAFGEQRKESRSLRALADHLEPGEIGTDLVVLGNPQVILESLAYPRTVRPLAFDEPQFLDLTEFFDNQILIHHSR